MADAIRMRLRWWQLPWYLALSPLYFTGRILLSGDPALAKVAVVAAVVVITGGVCAYSWTLGVLVRPDSLVVYGPLRVRAIPWRDIHAVDVNPLFGTKTVRIRLSSGWTRLRAPQTTRFIAPDPDFEAKANTIYWYWRAHSR